MHAAHKTVLLISTLLASCSKHEPDFRQTIFTKNHKISAVISGFQPRGTIEGFLSISFSDREDARKATFRHIDNGIVGWTRGGSFAVVGDNLTYDEISSDYFRDATFESRIKLTVCDRQRQDCSSLERQFEPGTTRHMAHSRIHRH